MSKTNKEINITEFILEIRYKPNPKVLDFRGSWAETLSAGLGLPEWGIIENRVDIFEKQEKERVFVGYKNAGFTCVDSSTANYFPDRALKFLKILFSLEGFGNILFLERIGVRLKSITSYTKDFDDLRDLYSSKFLNITEKGKEVLDGKLVDIGGGVDLIDKLGNYNTTSGPMIKDQMKKYINHKGEFPDVGFYFDIDYWTKPNKQIKNNDLLSTVKAFATECWNKKERINSLIIEN